MAKRRSQLVRELMERHGATQWQAEQVEDHPHAEYVLEYTIAKGLTPKEAAAQGKLWKVIDTRDDSSNHALAWGVTAYEAWQLARPRIAKRPAFHQCRFEVQT